MTSVSLKLHNYIIQGIDFSKILAAVKTVIVFTTPHKFNQIIYNSLVANKNKTEAKSIICFYHRFISINYHDFIRTWHTLSALVHI